MYAPKELSILFSQQLDMSSPVFQRVLEEQFQTHPTRKTLYDELEKLVERPVVTYCTSFAYPVMIEDSDAEMLEGILQRCDLSKGLALVISSPGGVGLAAERIINVCRSYSDTEEYVAIVPAKAKSAATMVCLGASKIIMGKTSELGTVDPQLTITEDGKPKRFSAYNIVKSYENLFNRAVKEDGNLQPYLQQLANYDEREIAKYKTALALSDDIAVRALKACMLKDLSDEEIKKKISIFLLPEKRAKVHGRPILADDAKKCGLNIEVKPVKDKMWLLLYELYVRLNHFVSINNNAKVIECVDKSFVATWHPRAKGAKK